MGERGNGLRIEGRQLVVTRSIGRFTSAAITTSCSLALRLSVLLLFISNAAVSFAFAADDSRVEDSKKWPAATALVQRLESLPSAPAVDEWASRTRRLLTELTEIEVSPSFRPSDRSAATAILTQLSQQSQQVTALAAQFQGSASKRKHIPGQLLVSQLYRVRYALDRRLAVWRHVVRMEPTVQNADQSKMRMASRGRVTFRPLDSQWGEYFLLADVQKQFNSLNPNHAGQQQAARRTLARMYSPVLKSEQAEFVEQAFDPTLVSMLKQAASDPVDTAKLLARIELHESRPSGASEFRLNDLYQSLVWSEQPGQQAVGAAIHTHYRNANVRLSVSGELLNRMVPAMPTTLEPVSERVLGAAVSGRSQISNHLQVELIPDPNQVQLRLRTQGTVHSNTVARRDGFAIQNQGLARFQVFKRLAFGREGVDSSEQPVAYSTADQQVVGMRSKLDGVPVVGWLARRAASQKIEQQAPKAKQLVQTKVERQASERMQEQVEQQLHLLRKQTYERVLQPLLALELEPEPVQMSTTHSELIMRYRLAGRDQMAANTARPAEPVGSLCSCQVHQSALNNAIARLELNGNKFTAVELKEHMRQVLGFAGQPVDPQAVDAGDEPPAQFEFAPFDAIRVGLNEQALTIQLNLRSLKIGEGKGKGWQRLSVTASYVPRVEGGKIVLEQAESGLRLKGKRLRFRDQVAIRTVCEVLFQPSYEITVLSPKFRQRVGGDVMLSQLVMTDGWLGLSIDDARQQAATQAVGGRVGEAKRSSAARRTRR